MQVSSADGAERQIRVTREIAAPPDALWAALTDPQRLEQWWGPPGFSVTTRGWNLVRGGSWHYTLHGRDGTEERGLIQFDDVHPLCRVSFTIMDAGPFNMGLALYVEVALERTGTGTRAILSASFTNSKEYEGARLPPGVRDRIEALLERLAELFEEFDDCQYEAGEELVIRVARELAVSPDLAWSSWTDPARMAAFWGPEGNPTTTDIYDLRAGGTWAVSTLDLDGTPYTSRLVFGTVDPPRRMTYAHLGTRRHPSFDVRVDFRGPLDGNRTWAAITFHFRGRAIRERPARSPAIVRAEEFLASFPAPPETG